MTVLIKSKWINGSQMQGKEVDLSKEELKYLDSIGVKYEVREVIKEPKQKEKND